MTLLDSLTTNQAVGKQQSRYTLNMDRVGCIILGGGQGSRLFPLTSTRCKPAINFGGRYLLIDIPLSNAINSNCKKIFVITQFLSSTLQRHIYHTYPMEPISGGFLEILGAEQKPSHMSWFQGTADAVRQNLNYILETPADYFLILSGDQLYNMRFEELVKFGYETDADLVIAALPVEEKDAKRMGVLKVDAQGRVLDFYEKPQEKALLNQFESPTAKIEQLLGKETKNKKYYLGSMGIYLFKKQALIDLLRKDPREDFGKHLIPSKVKEGKVSAFHFNGYWEDIGTIDSFYKANMALTEENPLFNCYLEDNPIYSTRYHLPGPKILNAQVVNSIICEGSIVKADELTNVILGPRTFVDEGSIIRNSYIMGHDFYTPPVKDPSVYPEQFKIGKGCVIKDAIIDTNVSIGNNVRLVNRKKLQHYDGDKVFIRDGVIVVPRRTELPDGFEI